MKADGTIMILEILKEEKREQSQTIKEDEHLSSLDLSKFFSHARKNYSAYFVETNSHLTVDLMRCSMKVTSKTMAAKRNSKPGCLAFLVGIRSSRHVLTIWIGPTVNTAYT
jgi:hypothetical protein